MVTTRRKSAVNYKEVTEDDMDIDGYVHDIDEAGGSSAKGATSDFDSDEDDRPKKKKAKTPAKRKKPAKGKITVRSLMKDLFTTLPLDLVYEIFGHLHPLDLLHLAWTSKLLRSHLMSKRSISVWKTAREAVVPAVPECPKDQSEPQWALLLFTHACTMCGTPRIEKVDWNLRLRGCEFCFKAHIINSRAAPKTYPDVEDLDVVLDLLPWADTQVYRYAAIHKCYYSESIVKMAPVVEDYQLRIDAGVKGAREDFDLFKARMRAEAEEQVESGEKMRAWASNAAIMRSLTNQRLKEERKEAIVAKLLEIGHDPRDVTAATTTTFYYTPAILDSTTAVTDIVWKRIKAKAEELVNEAKEDRLEKENSTTRNARRKIATARYAEFKKTYDASPDMLLPLDPAFLKLPPILQVVKQEGDDKSSKIFDEAFTGLAAVLDEYRKERILLLARTILASQASSDDVKNELDVTEARGLLSLATSAFHSCDPTPHFYGNEDTQIYWLDTMHTHYDADRIHFRATYGESVDIDCQCMWICSGTFDQTKQLIEAVGLDPNTATTSDMDNLDARIWCKDCGVAKDSVPFGSDENKWINFARTWRNCIKHLVYHTYHPWTGWEVVSSEDRPRIEANEKAAVKVKPTDWDSVSISLDGRAIRLSGRTYDIPKPKPPPQPRMPLKPQASASKSNSLLGEFAPVTKYKCKLCPFSNREFILEGLRSHCKDKHGVKQEDFRVEDLIRI